MAYRGQPVVALAPGSVAPARRWPVESYAELARLLAAEGKAVWVLGGPAERAFAQDIAAAAPASVRDLTGTEFRNAILALAAADVAIANDSGLLHVAAAAGTPTIGIYGPYSPARWGPLNPLAAAIEAAIPLPCQPCEKATCRMVHHRCMRDIPAAQVHDATRAVLAGASVAR
jgi:heptosyltransferase-2